MNEKFYDVIVIGGGPAGLTAALYLARARYRVLVVEKEKFGGQITITSDVVNYPGVERASGEELTAVMRKQAQHFGAEFLLAEVESVDLQNEERTVFTSRGEYKAFGVIIATGARPRKIGFAGEEEFKGRGVAYCATCDGEFFTGLDVFVLGGGFAAAEEAVFLTKYAKHVTILVREDDFTCAKAVADLAKNSEKITVFYNTIVEAVAGETDLQLLKYKNLKTGELHEYRPPAGETFGVFVFAGYEPETSLVKGQVELTDFGYVKTDHNRRTNVSGIYAAGDVCEKNLRQVVTATADGAIAATELERYVASMQEKTGIISQQPATRIVQKKQEKASENSLESGVFTPEIRSQLESVFQKIAKPVLLQVYLDERPVSAELKSFVQELASFSEKLTAEFMQTDSAKVFAPVVRLLRENKEDTGIAFHGVPGGHEFNSFVIALYNAAGPGQALDKDLRARINNIQQPVQLKILISLACTMCPELVMAAQRIAAENQFVTAEAYDLNHFPQLREQYKIMSVPCLVINDDLITFGKKNITQLVETLEEYLQK